MKVLMFGWEFPPNISGGLGTACSGLTKGLYSLEDIEVTFVVPKVFGGEDASKVRLIGASDVPVTKLQIRIETSGKAIECIEVSSQLVPYVDPEDYYRQINYTVEHTRSLIETDIQRKLKISIVILMINEN